MQISRRRRSVAATAVGAAVVALGLLGPAGPSGSANGASAAAHRASDCPDGTSASAHRQFGGGDGTDPNSVSAAEATSMEAQLQAGLDALDARVAARQQAKGKHHHGHGHHGHHFRLPKFVKIDVYFHVITQADGTGDVTNKQLRQQIRVLNAGYRGKTSDTAAKSPFFFKLAGVDRTANDDWYAWSDPDVDPSDDSEAKHALHQGSFRDLNVYVAGLEDGLLGYAYYPNEVELWQDGVVILNDSLPGGAAAPYNEGDTLTHEAGHWLYLLHTFENGCEKPGDLVWDTPYQLDGDNIFECDESLDTCAQPGRDPVHNFMSYGDDPCLDEFTKGQSLRMTYAWLVFRARR